jgi:hypothetical protein
MLREGGAMSEREVGSTPASTDPDELEREFFESLRQAAWIFEKESNGRFHGPVMACRAVVRFIKLRGHGVELAGPFWRIAEAFEDLERGGKPGLFAKKVSANKERDRSPERKVIHRLAAAALEGLVNLGDELSVAAAHVARYVNDWPGMGHQNVKDVTVINWRKQQQRPNNRHQDFGFIVKAVLAGRDPRGEIESLLKNGPPALWKR